MPAAALALLAVAAVGVAGSPVAAPEQPVTSPADTVARPPAMRDALIPFPPQRKAQMARYSRLHYGTAQWRLHPRGIVLHYTGTDSLASVLATFRGNAPDPELGQLPGVCAHYVVDRDGTVYRVVRPTIRCRHTVGLNHRTIGIEHVGTSDAAVMGNPAQRRASLRLAAWLTTRHGIAVGDVIGHAESPRSRYRRELYRPWHCQTHGDFARPAAARYRSLLAPRVSGRVPNAPPRWQDNGC